MSNKTVGFVGGGRIVRIFVEGWKRANALPTRIAVSDCNADSLAKLEMRVAEMYRTRLPALFQKIRP